jgi:toxin YoeB
VKVAFTDSALEELTYWVQTDTKMAKKILALIDQVTRSPYSGTGKPEPLKHALAGRWSRRIDDEHRLVYRIIDIEGESVLEISACRFHYMKR